MHSFSTFGAVFGGLLAAAGAVLAGCSSLGYYAHVARGEGALLLARRPIAAVVADPATDSTLRTRLALAVVARAFASDHLDLPRNRSYTTYVALDRPYVTWSVFAAPEFSVAPIEHCFAFAGCVAYRGYFDEASAKREAERLEAAGDDTYIDGIVAYSTLGWFADPITSSMLRWSDDELAAVIFHELAHQKIYLKDDTAFNESYASFVEEEGLREWCAAHGLPAAIAADDAIDREFSALVLDLRDRLKSLYARGLPAASLRAAKNAEIDAFRARYRMLRGGPWRRDSRHDRWVDMPINNAKLVPFGLYERWRPAFAAVFRHCDSGWPCFYRDVETLASLRPADRSTRLQGLLDESAHSAAR